MSWEGRQVGYPQGYGALPHRNGPQLLTRWTRALDQSTGLGQLLFEDSYSHAGSSCQLGLPRSEVSPRALVEPRERPSRLLPLPGGKQKALTSRMLNFNNHYVLLDGRKKYSEDNIFFF